MNFPLLESWKSLLTRQSGRNLTAGCVYQPCCSTRSRTSLNQKQASLRSQICRIRPSSHVLCIMECFRNFQHGVKGWKGIEGLQAWVSSSAREWGQVCIIDRILLMSIKAR